MSSPPLAAHAEPGAGPEGLPWGRSLRNCCSSLDFADGAPGFAGDRAAGPQPRGCHQPQPQPQPAASPRATPGEFQEQMGQEVPRARRVTSGLSVQWPVSGLFPELTCPSGCPSPSSVPSVPVLVLAGPWASAPAPPRAPALPDGSPSGGAPLPAQLCPSSPLGRVPLQGQLPPLRLPVPTGPHGLQLGARPPSGHPLLPKSVMTQGQSALRPQDRGQGPTQQPCLGAAGSASSASSVVSPSYPEACPLSSGTQEV